MRDPDAGLYSSRRRVLEATFNKLLTRLRLYVLKRIVDVIKEVGGGKNLSFDVTNRALHVIEDVVKTRFESVSEFIDGVG